MTPQLRGIEASPVKNGGVDLLDSPHMPASASLREDQRQFDRAVRVRLLGELFFDECAYDSPRETHLMFARGMFDESGTHNAAPIGGDGGWVIDPRRLRSFNRAWCAVLKAYEVTEASHQKENLDSAITSGSYSKGHERPGVTRDYFWAITR